MNIRYKYALLSNMTTIKTHGYLLIIYLELTNWSRKYKLNWLLDTRS